MLDRLAPGTWPHPDRIGRDGLGGIGGDLSRARLLAAYDHGYFPCHGADTPPLWWNPDPRAVITPASLHVSRRLERTLRQGRFEVTFDRAFRRVMEQCDVGREDGRWILPEMIEAYVDLFAAGHAHSFEVWRGDRLAGGLYGVQRGALFAAESMFHRETDMSKVALVSAARALFAAGIEVIDVQYPTPHLRSLGAIEWRRAQYLASLAQLLQKAVALGGIRFSGPAGFPM